MSEVVAIATRNDNSHNTAAPLISPPVAFAFVKGKDYLALPRDPQPWLIEHIVPSGGLMNLYGKPKLGKSYAALGLAIAISDPSQTEWLGFRVLKHGAVMYLQVDTPRSEWANRNEKIVAAGHNIDNIYFTDANLVPYPVDITLPVIREALEAAIKTITPPPVLLVVDTLREVHNGNENDSGDMKKVITSIVQACRPYGMSVLLVSHSRKDITLKGEKADDDLMNDGRGSSYTSGRMDVVGKLTEKQLILKGRSIGDTRIPVEQDKKTGMIVGDKEKSMSDAHVRFVLANPQLTSDRSRAEMLAALEKIEPEAARSRIRSYRKKIGQTTTDEDGATTTESVCSTDS